MQIRQQSGRGTRGGEAFRIGTRPLASWPGSTRAGGAPPRRLAATGGALALAAAALVPGSVAPAAAAPGDVIAAGQVWEDNDGDGVFDGDGTDGFVERGVGNVTVTVTDAAGNSAATRTNRVDAAGGWSMTEGEFTAQTGVVPVVPDGATVAPLRVTFSDVPARYESWLAGGLADNGTSVQFIDAGDQAVDYAILQPGDHRVGSPDLVTPIQSAGDPLSSSSGSTSLIASDWSGGGNTPVATFGETGSLWGTAYEESSNAILASAVYKRLSGLAEHRWDGSTDRALGAIYRVPDAADPATGNIVAGVGSIQPWFTLTDLGIDVGTVPSNADRGLGDPSLELPDADAFAQAAKVGIGSIDTWTDGVTTYLYAMNLADQTLYRIDISPTIPTSPDHDPTFVPSAEDVLAIPLGLGEDERPWAVDVDDGQVYVGWAETGAAPGNCAATSPDYIPGPEWPLCGSTEALHAHVGVTGLDGGGVAQVLDIDLGYPRETPMAGWGDQGDRYTNENPQVRHWNSWTDLWSWDTTDADGNGWPDGSVGLDVSDGNVWAPQDQYIQAYPQAMVSSITFDSAGYMTVGMADRTQLQSGNLNWASDATEPGGTGPQFHFQSLAAGDQLLAGQDPDGVFSYEFADAATATGHDGETTTRVGGRSSARQSGPGGQEFYHDNQGLDNTVREQINHEENSLGSVLHLAGSTDVAGTAYDALEPIRVQSLQWMNVDSGLPMRGIDLTADPGQSDARTASFQKGGGLGDLDALVPPAPIEIGNRVWFDGDGDGTQDAGEPGVGGVTVELVDATDAVVGTQVTADDGTYYFSSDPTDTAHFTELVPGAEYTVRFVPPTEGDLIVDYQGTSVTVPWSSVSFTTMQAPTGDNPHGDTDNADGVNPRPTPPEPPAPVEDADRIDSNPDPSTGEYTFVLGGHGNNDHSIDAGIVQEILGSIGDCVWLDENGDGIQDEGEPGVEGVTVTLYDAEGNEVATTTTTADCGYLFTDLPLGDYSVGFTDIPEGMCLVSPGAGDDPELDSDADPSTGRTGTVTIGEDWPNRLDIDAGLCEETTEPDDPDEPGPVEPGPDEPEPQDPGPTAPDPGAMPVTGANAAVLTLLSAMSIIAGVILLRWHNRRRRTV